jgi:predicted CopG family antitoxin
MTKTIVIDQNAYEILLWAKEQNVKDGIESPDHSEAIRWLKKNINEASVKKKVVEPKKKMVR